MAEVEIGLGKSGRRAYGFDDIAIVPSRRTRDPEDVDISWEIDAFRFDLPLMGAAMDGVISPATAIEIGRLGGVGVLNLEGLWTRYEDPEPLFAEIAELDADKATLRMQDIYGEPIKPELVTARIRQIRETGVVSCRERDATTHREARARDHRRRARPARDPRHGGVGGARLEDRRAAQPQAVRARARHPRDRGWLRLLSSGIASHAHRGGRRPRRCRSWAHVHDTRRARHRGPAGDRDRRCSCRSDASPRRDGRVRAGHCRRWHGDRRRHREGDRVWRRRGDDRLAARGSRGGTRARLPLGDGDVPPDVAPRRAREDVDSAAR